MKFGLDCCNCSLASVSQVSAKPVWNSLFDGKTLEGWSNPFEWGEVSVEQNEIVLREIKSISLFLMLFIKTSNWKRKCLYRRVVIVASISMSLS